MLCSPKLDPKNDVQKISFCSRWIVVFFFFQEKASCWMSAHGLFLVMFVCAHLAPDRRGQNKKRSKFQPTRKYGIEHGISWLYHLFESLSDYGYITFLESLSEFEWFDFLFSIRSPLVPRTNIFSGWNRQPMDGTQDLDLVQPIWCRLWRSNGKHQECCTTVHPPTRNTTRLSCGWSRLAYVMLDGWFGLTF